MDASQLINNSIVALRKTDTVASALTFMSQQGALELPIIEKNKVYNYARSILLLDMDPAKKLEEVIPLNPHAPVVYLRQHLYEIVPVFASANLQFIAVLNENEEFAGIVDQRNIYKTLATSLTYRGPGAVILVQLEDKNFAPSQIARLIEENGAKIIGMMVDQLIDGDLMVNIKVNTTLVRQICATLNRFGFTVKECYMAEDWGNSDEKEFDSVLRFFDI
jgi:predicted transcriptional regulator